MKIILGIWAGLAYLCSRSNAQSSYNIRPISQELQYDDDTEQNNRQHNERYLGYGIVRQPTFGVYRTQPEQNTPVYYKPASSPYPQTETPYNYHNPSVINPVYQPISKQEHRLNDYKYKEPEKTFGKYQNPETEDASIDYKTKTEPKETGYQHDELEYKKIDYPKLEADYPKPEVDYRKPKNEYISLEEPSHKTPQDQQDDLQYSQLPETGAAHHKSSEPEAHRNSLVPRDPRLPLYFTMYEKRTIQDPLDHYGKGPWRYLTYGHGITYGSKEPGKVFERGYGYIRALGRDHCKLPKHLCPTTDEKPFEYEGRKEPYFGYRPH